MMEASKLNHVAQKLYEYNHCTDQLEFPFANPTWYIYLPQAEVALKAAAEWNAYHQKAGSRG